MVDRNQLPPNVRVAVEWIAIDLPNIVNGLGDSLSALKHDLRNLTREVETMEVLNEGFKASVADIKRRLGLS